MLEPNIALHGPLLQRSALRNGHCNGFLTLVSLLLGLGLSLAGLLGLVPWSLLHVTVHDPADVMAWAPHTIGTVRPAWAATWGQMRGLCVSWHVASGQAGAHIGFPVTPRLFSRWVRSWCTVAHPIAPASAQAETAATGKVEDDYENWLSEYVTTSAGVQMPRVIYGVAGLGAALSKKQNTEEDVLHAVHAGMRAVDTMGHPTKSSEPWVGAALSKVLESGVGRESLFIQTKVNPDIASVESPGAPITKQVQLSIAYSLSHLTLEYVDSLLLHSPSTNPEKTMQAWRAMEDAYDLGLVRQLGLSNITSIDQLKRVYESAKQKPAIIQQQFAPNSAFGRELLEYCTEMGIYLQSPGILVMNRRAVGSKMMKDLAKKYSTQLGYSVAPSMLFYRFMMSQAVMPIIGAHSGDKISERHLKQDVATWRIPLTDEDAAKIEALLKLSPEGEETELHGTEAIRFTLKKRKTFKPRTLSSTAGVEQFDHFNRQKKRPVALQRRNARNVPTLAEEGLSATDLEYFLLQNPVDERAARMLREADLHVQHAVVKQGPVNQLDNPSAAIAKRVMLAGNKPKKPQPGRRENEFATAEAPGRLRPRTAQTPDGGKRKLKLRPRIQDDSLSKVAAVGNNRSEKLQLRFRPRTLPRATERPKSLRPSAAPRKLSSVGKMASPRLRGRSMVARPQVVVKALRNVDLPEVENRAKERQTGELSDDELKTILSDIDAPS